MMDLRWSFLVVNNGKLCASGKRACAPNTANAPVAGIFLGHRGQLEVTPAAAEDFHVIFAPADVGFVGPALLVQAFQDGVQKLDAVHKMVGPVTRLVEGNTSVAQGDGIKVLPGDGGGGLRVELPVIARPAAHNGLEKEEQRDEGTRPEP